MSEKELNHEERLALSMKARIQQLVYLTWYKTMETIYASSQDALGGLQL
jgi:deoxycytidine triphosphate deaminase